MSSGKRDANRNVVLMGVSSVDGVTPVPLKVDPDTGKLLAYAQSASDSIAAGNSKPVKRDGNRVHGLMGECSVDATPIPLTVDPTSSGLRIAGA